MEPEVHVCMLLCFFDFHRKFILTWYWCWWYNELIQVNTLWLHHLLMKLVLKGRTGQSYSIWDFCNLLKKKSPKEIFIFERSRNSFLTQQIYKLHEYKKKIIILKTVWFKRFKYDWLIIQPLQIVRHCSFVLSE